MSCALQLALLAYQLGSSVRKRGGVFGGIVKASYAALSLAATVAAQQHVTDCATVTAAHTTVSCLQNLQACDVVEHTAACGNVARVCGVLC